MARQHRFLIGLIAAYALLLSAMLPAFASVDPLQAYLGAHLCGPSGSQNDSAPADHAEHQHKCQLCGPSCAMGGSVPVAALADGVISVAPFSAAIAVPERPDEGNLGLWNTILNTVYCLTVIFMCVSGIVMWWKRRPAGSLGAPRYPRDYRIPRAVLGIAVLVSLAFPLTGIAILAFAVIDFLLPKRLKQAAAAA